MEDGKQKEKKKKKEKFPSAREAVPSQTYRVLSVIAKCVLMEWKLFVLHPLQFSQKQSSLTVRVKIFFLHKEKWIHRHFINFGILHKDDVKKP